MTFRKLLLPLTILAGIILAIASYLFADSYNKFSLTRAACTPIREEAQADIDRHADEEWTNCIAQLALEKQDAKHCLAAGNIFSPWPGQCMSIIATEARDSTICSTIPKPTYRKLCIDRPSPSK